MNGAPPGFTPILASTLTCPHCGFAQLEIMPTDACLWHYECAQCHALLRPKPGDCCVFCSYGTVPCPSIQEKRRLKFLTGESQGP